MFQINVPGLDALPGAAAEMLNILGKRRIVAFYGEMGAGKTTFIKALCDVLEVTDVTSSPSFALINEYRSKRGEPVYHFDLYRVRNTDEVYDLGYEEFMYSGNYCFIEWAEKMEMMLPEDAVKVYIRIKEKGERTIHLDLAG